MSNDGFLEQATHWVRLRMLLVVERTESDVATEFGYTESDLIETTQQLQQLTAANPQLPFMVLSRTFNLSQFEEQLLLLCAAQEVASDIGLLCQQLFQQPAPTFALARLIFEQADWRAISPDGALRYWRLLEINQPADRPLSHSLLRIDERVMSYLKGLTYLDDRLRPYTLPIDPKTSMEVLPASQAVQVERALSYIQQADGSPIVQLVGADLLSKQLVAQQIVTRLGLNFYSLALALLPSRVTDLEDFARLWHRESLLQPLALTIEAHDLGDGSPQEITRLQRFLRRSGGLFLIETRQVWYNLGQANLVVDVQKPSPREQIAAWSEVIPPDFHPQAATQLAAQFNLNLTTIRQIAQQHTLPPVADSKAAEAAYDTLWAASLAETRPSLERLAQRLTPKAKWQDIVLPDVQRRLLHHIANQVRQRGTVYETWGFRERSSRGLGITVLFAGESGTGKTMAAEILANHLKLNLYRIDLSSVISKYIGETEKNLRALFDAAEDGGAILFFDEADAIFGKRSEVKDSHDRYANIEVNYLLQRMEAFQGLAILATNLKSSLDEAFTRRLRFVVTFSKPDEENRRLIWQKVFPTETPVEGLDYDYLAKTFKLTGGSIYNISLNAAFLAATASRPITMPIVLEAVRIELSKEDRLLNEDDFVWPPNPQKSEKPVNPSAIRRPGPHPDSAKPPSTPASKRQRVRTTTSVEPNPSKRRQS